jgi:FkbM family methyltransferase
MNLRYLAKSLFRRMGYLVETYSIYRDPPALLLSFLSSNGIDVVFDVGANEGQFAGGLRRNGYKGKIVSFEPVRQSYEKLVAHAEGDRAWQTVNSALGSFDGNAVINVSASTASSSMLDILPRHLESAPGSEYVRQEEISVRKLDSIIDTYLAKEERLYLKVDTQGFEKHVIDGAENSLERIRGIQLEMSLVPLYEGETLIGEMIGLLSRKQFGLLSLEPVWRAAGTHELLQVDGIFFRRE